jgi:hypothetical protein
MPWRVRACRPVGLDPSPAGLGTRALDQSTSVGLMNEITAFTTAEDDSSVNPTCHLSADNTCYPSAEAFTGNGRSPYCSAARNSAMTSIGPTVAALNASSSSAGTSGPSAACAG